MFKQIVVACLAAFFLAAFFLAALSLLAVAPAFAGIKTVETGAALRPEPLAASPSDAFPARAQEAVQMGTAAKRDDHATPCTPAGSRPLDVQFMFRNH